MDARGASPTLRSRRRRCAPGAASGATRKGRGVTCLGVLLLVLCVPSLAGAADDRPVFPDLTRAGTTLPAAAIGRPGEFKAYFPIHAGCPLTLQGPGMLRFYVRAHVPAAGAAPESVTVIVSGFRDYPPQRWQRAVSPSRVSVYGDGRDGRLTGGVKVTLAIPAGRQELTLRGASDVGQPLYAIFYYDGPPLPEPGAAEITPPPAAEPAPPKPATTPKAKPAAKPKAKKSPWALASNLMLDLIYDDNICRYSDDSLEEFRRGDRPEKYAIETDDDLILNPTLQVELSHARLLFRKRTRLRVRYKRWDYVRNSIKTNEEINLRLRQHVRRYDYLEATYTYAPNSYIKELSDRPPFVSRSVPREYLHFAITRNAFNLGYRWRAARWLSMRFFGGRTLRFYNRPFLENDLWEWNGSVAGDLTYRRFTTRLQYSYADVTARGYDEVGETLETSDNDGDGSYEKDTYRLAVTYRPARRSYRAPEVEGGLGRKAWGVFQRAGAWLDRGLHAVRTASCAAQYTYTRQFYTSQRPLHIDPLHVGRLDESNQVQIVWASKALYRQVTAELGYRYTVRTADAPAGIIGEDDPSEEKDYTGTRIWVSFSTPLR